MKFFTILGLYNLLLRPLWFPYSYRIPIGRFKSTQSFALQFEARRLPRAFLVLLEGLLHVVPSGRPSCERVSTAIRDGMVCFLPYMSLPCFYRKAWHSSTQSRAHRKERKKVTPLSRLFADLQVQTRIPPRPPTARNRRHDRMIVLLKPPSTAVRNGKKKQNRFSEVFPRRLTTSLPGACLPRNCPEIVWSSSEVSNRPLSWPRFGYHAHPLAFAFTDYPPGYQLYWKVLSWTSTFDCDVSTTVAGYNRHLV
jgi:hypothetical protein